MILDRNNYILTPTPLEADLLKLFKKDDYLKILDIGGCEGEESIRYLRLFPNAKIFIFEPLPSNQTLIKKNFVEFNVQNAELIPAALSHSDGYADFYVSSGHPASESKELNWDFGNKSSSLLEPDGANILNWLKFKDKITVRTMTLDTFLMEHKIDKIDFIHMDVQGAELQVLKGAKKNLEKIKAIWLEVADISFYKNQALRKDVEKFMKRKNFSLIKSEMQGQAGDQFYVRKERKSILNSILNWFE